MEVPLSLRNQSIDLQKGTGSYMTKISVTKEFSSVLYFKVHGKKHVIEYSFSQVVSFRTPTFLKRRLITGDFL